MDDVAVVARVSVGQNDYLCSSQILQSNNANTGFIVLNQSESTQATEQSVSGSVQTVLNLTNAELVQLQVRVIALENLVIALLTGAPDKTLCIARALAADIYPRDTSTPHPLTIRAAELMVHMVERSALVPDRLKTN